MDQCSCGKPALPYYNGKCEDCYLDGISYLGCGPSYREISYRGNEIGGYVTPGMAYDRHWNRPKDSIYR